MITEYSYKLNPEYFSFQYLDLECLCKFLPIFFKLTNFINLSKRYLNDCICRKPEKF